MKRPPKRYVGFSFEPAGASRREVGLAIEAAWRRAEPGRSAPAPRLLVCERGVGIVVVPRALAQAARGALKAQGLRGPIRLTPVVTSGTIASVKRRLHLIARAPSRGP